MNKDDYAVIEENLIVNTVLWDGVTPWSQPDGSTVMLLADALAAGIQYAPIPTPTRRVWSSAAEFWASFTQLEQVAVSASNIAEVRALVVSLSVWRDELWSDDDRVQLGFQALIQSGLISEGRASEILNPPGLKPTTI
jgi:hypothetical protein